jgi:hypothetical protein
MQKIDLHLHSNKSDGKLKPSEIPPILIKKGIEVTALTDHDSVDGSKEFSRLAQKVGVKTLTGVEISAHEYGVGVHILGYGIDTDNAELHKFFRMRSIERRKVFKKYVNLFKKYGFKINTKLYAKYQKIKSVTAAHVFKLIWSVPANRKLSFEKYGLKESAKGKEAFRIQSPFIDMFMTLPRQIAYAKKKPVSAKEVIRLIYKLGGIAVWAHPGLEFEFRNKPVFFKKVFNSLLSHGLDGLEAYSTASSHTEKWKAYLCGLAKKHNLLITMGTDDHDGNYIGSLNVPQKVQKDILKNLLAKLEK